VKGRRLDEKWFKLEVWMDEWIGGWLAGVQK
jgi:hypothetical protein